MERTCPYCGAPLPGEAAFCPRCTRTVNDRARPKMPRSFSYRLRRVLWIAGAVLALTLVLLGVYLPRTYEGQAELYYADGDGAYQLTLTGSNSSSEPVPERRLEAAADAEYRYPIQLYICRADSGERAGEAFLRKVDWVQVDFTDPGGGSVIAATLPAPRPDYAPEAALVSFVDFVAREDFSARMTWTLRMKNGDTLRLYQDHSVATVRTHDIYPEDVPMSTAAELQALIDRLSGELPAKDVVNLHLPAVTYDEEVVVSERALNFCGAAEGDRRTTFTAPLRLESTSDTQISYIENIDFRGSGNGIALSAAARARAVGCAFTGWKTGFLAYGTAWCNVIGCTLEDNQTGFHCKSTGGSVSHTMYDNNIFRNNGAAVVLENVPADIALNFQGSVFEGNGTDIDNRCGHPVDISGAIFR